MLNEEEEEVKKGKWKLKNVREISKHVLKGAFLAKKSKNKRFCLEKNVVFSLKSESKRERRRLKRKRRKNCWQGQHVIYDYFMAPPIPLFLVQNYLENPLVCSFSFLLLSIETISG